MVETGSILKQDILNWFDDSFRLNGIEITYKRFEEETYDPDSGNTITYDTATIDAVTTPIQAYETAQDSRLQHDDKRVVFKQSDFPYTSTKGDDKPTSRDKVIIDGETWSLDLNGDTIYETDDTETMYFVYVRRS